MHLRLFALIAVAGCAAPEPLVVLSPPESVSPPPLASPELRPVVIAVEVEPLSPVGADSGQVAQRRVYEGAQVAEWTLDNGLTVVYRWSSDADGYVARLSALGGWRALAPQAEPLGATAQWGPLDAIVLPDSRVAYGVAPRLDQLLESVRGLFSRPPDSGTEGIAPPFDRPTAFTLVMHGPVAWEWVESAIGSELSGLRGRRATVAPERIDEVGPVRASVLTAGAWRYGVAVQSSDLPALAVLSEAVRERGADLGVEPDGVAVLTVAASESREELWSSLSDGDLREYRARAALAARAPEGQVRAIADLYSLSGRFRPVRPPAEAVALGDAVERVTPGRVRDLLDRFRTARPLRILSPDE